MVVRIVQIVVVSFCLSLMSHAVSADTLQNKGLFVSPTKQVVTVAAGGMKRASVTVYNYYTKTLHVDFAVKEFTATGESYKYTFQNPIENWIDLSSVKDGIDLQKGADKTIQFTVAAPKDATPGDHYFAIFASTDMSGAGFRQTAQVASLVYAQVDGGKIVRSANIENANVPAVVFGPTLDYGYNVKNNGNVHFDAYFYARLENIFGKYPMAGGNQVVLAKTTRAISGTISMPLLPGLYKMSYGYISDDQSQINTRTATIVFIPPWVVAGIIFVGLAVVFMTQRQKKSSDDA